MCHLIYHTPPPHLPFSFEETAKPPLNKLPLLLAPPTYQVGLPQRNPSKDCWAEVDRFAGPGPSGTTCNHRGMCGVGGQSR
jgi:hypothetical protein